MKFPMISVISTAALLALVAAPHIAVAQGHVTECEPGEHIDGSTSDQAKRKLEAAGYRQVRGLHKGCDNVWHGQAMQNGQPVNVMLSPDGQALVEGD